MSINSELKLFVLFRNATISGEEHFFLTYNSKYMYFDK